VLCCAVLALQESIRGCDVFLVQPTCPPVNDNLMELLVTIDACRRASARSITTVLPYYGYARADRKTQVRQAALVLGRSCAELCAELSNKTAGSCSPIPHPTWCQTPQQLWDLQR
jgi:ribose-phosphate pyrophosphokinase